MSLLEVVVDDDEAAVVIADVPVAIRLSFFVFAGVDFFRNDDFFIKRLLFDLCNESRLLSSLWPKLRPANCNMSNSLTGDLVFNIFKRRFRRTFFRILELQSLR